MRRILLTLLLFTAFCKTIKAQELGEYPTSIKWNQINTDTVRVIFPKGMEEYAMRVCNLTTELQKKHSFSIGNKHRKLNIVLRNQSVISNGYVGLAPFRSEFYTTPPPQNDDLGSLPWLDLLSIHEYRHAMQFSNSNQGLSRFGYFFMGDYGLAVLSNLSVPNWFWEGDAVCNETALSAQGRGRLPSFYLGFKTLEQSGTRYSYMKVRNGSFKDYVPNHYELGYLMCSYARNKFDNNVWNNVFAKGVGYNYYVYPFSRALKANTSLNTKGLYNKSFDSYSSNWKIQNSQLTLTPTNQVITKDLEKVYSNYLNPTFDKNGTIFCLKKSFNRPASFVSIDKNGNEKRLCLAGLTLEENFSLGQNKLAWTQYHSNIRWSGLVYSEIVTYDINTHKKNTLTKNGKYFSPSISPTEEILVAACTEKPDFNKLVILKLETGEKIKELGEGHNYFYTNPVFDKSGKNIITSVRNASGQMALLKIDIETGIEETLTPFSFNTIGRAFESSTGIYFTASYSGIDNLYQLDKQKNIIQVSSVETGVSAAAIDTLNQQFALSMYTKDGYRIEYLPVNLSLNKNVSIVEPEAQQIYATNYAKKEGGNILNNIPVTKREVTTYNSFLHPFRIHSWQLFSNGQNQGLMLFAENTLHTLSGSFGVIYNKNEEKPYFAGDVSISTFFPILHFAANTTINESKLDATPKYYQNKQEVKGGIQIPLNFSKGSYYRLISSEIGLQKTQLDGLIIFSEKYSGYSQGYYANFSFLNQKQQAYQNLGSPMSQLIKLSYNESTQGYKSKLFRADGFFSLVGLLPNHNIKLQAHYGKQSFDIYEFRFTDDFYYTPGYKAYSDYSDIKRIEISYHLPLCYPDWGFAGIFYLRRIQLAGYYNYSDLNIGNNKPTLHMNSTGGAMTFDTKIFNIQSVSWGLRYNYRLNTIDAALKGNDIDLFFVIGSF